jgi:hypothetical protein
MVMFKVTRFMAVPYERRPDGSVTRGEVRQVYTLEEARALARVMRKRCAKVEVYGVTGWPVQDLWDRPQRVRD